MHARTEKLCALLIISLGPGPAVAPSGARQAQSRAAQGTCRRRRRRWRARRRRACRAGPGRRVPSTAARWTGGRREPTTPTARRRRRRRAEGSSWRPEPHGTWRPLRSRGCRWAGGLLPPAPAGLPSPLWFDSGRRTPWDRTDHARRLVRFMRGRRRRVVEWQRSDAANYGIWGSNRLDGVRVGILYGCLYLDLLMSLLSTTTSSSLCCGFQADLPSDKQPTWNETNRS